MIDDLYFVVKDGQGKQYLVDVGFSLPNDEMVETWDDKDGWHYQSYVVLADAERVNGRIFLVLPNGREIEVSPEDLTFKKAK